MSLALRVYNVLLYEPRSVKPGMRIARWILSDLVAKANSRFALEIIRNLVRNRVIPKHTTLGEFGAISRRLSPAAVRNIDIPEEEQFLVNVKPYEELGRVPDALGDLAQMHDRLAPRGIAVTFFNTACSGPLNDYDRLAEVIYKFPGIRRSVWLATASLHNPIPKSFMDLFAEKTGAAPGGSSGSPWSAPAGNSPLIPFGDSIVVRAKVEAVRLIYDRLVQMRKADCPVAAGN